MITTFGDKATARIFQGKFVYSLPLHMQTLAYRKLLMIDAAESVRDLHAPPPVRFNWGPMELFAVIEKLGRKVTMFHPARPPLM